MKAAQFFARGDIRVVDVPKPEPGEHEALVAIEWGGICGSDLHEYEYGPIAIPLPEHPHPATGNHIPVTMGHEFAGRIVSAPPGSGLKPGQAVMVDPRIYCSKCSRCNAGSTHGCTTLGFKGLSGTGGGFSEAVAIDAKLCYPLPDDVDLSLAALIEPLAVAWHAISLCDARKWSEKSVLILGGGPIGIACALGLRARGCNQIFVSEPTATRAAQNKQVSDAVFNPIHENVAEKCREVTGGEGVEVVFDCAGVQKGFDAGMDALRYRGLYMNVAAWGTPMVVPFVSYILKEITMKCALAYDDNDFRETVDAFVAGKFKGVETMVTSRIHLDDVATKGFDELVHHKDNHIKILVTPDKSKV
ncbi:GroES-like protein [Ophiobolus disseminans]|uniref:GroES-like protein n=1 Tax=Ophiobolus disseminans TaxID=1469910 RepID=A0A6A6ZX66_9PLEO|nr:GroES-like protein [Ophiobolus disseminans]